MFILKASLIELLKSYEFTITQDEFKNSEMFFTFVVDVF